jgi:hypothetical protein
MIPLIQIEEELPDVPVMLVTGRQRQPTSLALYLKKIFNQGIIGTWRRIRITGQATKPFQKTASNVTEVLLRPASGSSPPLSHSSCRP